MVQLSHPYMTTGTTTALTRWIFVGKVLSLLFNTLSRLVIAFLPRTKYLLISWQWSPSAVILESKKIKSLTVSIVSPSICREVMGQDAMILVFWMLSFQPAFHSPLSLSLRGSLVPLHFLPLRWYHLHIWGGRYFSWNLDSNLCFIQCGISPDVLCIQVKQADDDITLIYSFPNFEPVHFSMSDYNCCFLTCR